MRRLKVKNGGDGHSLMDLSFFQTLIIDIYQLHWSLEYMYIHKTTINLFGASAIILKNISQYCCMYNNRIYIEKFYCTYILSITSVASYPQRHQAPKRYSRTVYISNNLRFNSIQSTAACSVPGPSVSVRFLKYVHTTDDLTYKNRCCLVSLTTWCTVTQSIHLQKTTRKTSNC